MLKWRTSIETTGGTSGDIRTWLRIVIVTRSGISGSGNVHLSNRGSRIEVSSLRSSDLDDGTVHVHFSVTHVVEPGPSEDDLVTVGCFSRDSDGVFGKVRRASSNQRLDDTESVTLIIRKRELARTTVVSSSDIPERYSLSGTSSPGSDSITSTGVKILELTSARIRSLAT